MTKREGIFLVFEGIDGSGKSNAVKNLAEHLRKKGYSVLITAEPSNGETGKKLRKALRNKEMPEKERRGLFIEDRKEHLRDIITPALKKGSIVLCDRYIHSNFAYQGAGGENTKKLEELNRFATKPDRTFYFDISVGDALKRVRQRSKTEKTTHTIYEKEDFLRKVQEIYELYSDDFIRIDATRSEQEIVQKLLASLPFT